ncbi:MAG: TIGR02186 family protein [Pseudomonadota bacterium]|nr:TIGR02186 family protein [Pseudomonadota bacterium]MEC7943388.1 TIGR02186 family protein [Pseudomonadota bacterium]MEC8086801.1 TIGR02186 family protein [Pseudomonadota bacterium]MEC8727115.1 TIGR02186 family protein [Pseudomonadota bacterium]MEC9206485.1 TIGR02186 family protein [Pseudomonadota bacterium]
MARLLSFLLALLVIIPAAKSQRLALDLSNDEVAISTGFTGTELLLFGATEGHGDIVVTVVGPRSDEVVWRKERVAGIWVSGDSITFKSAPAYYLIAASRPLQEIASPEILHQMQIGVAEIELSTGSQRSDAEVAAYREALIRNKKRRRLYSQDISNIKIVRDLLFRSTIPFPASVPTGEYQITVYLFKNGEPVSQQTTSLPVRKVGLGAQLYKFAHQQAPLYGAIAIAIALLAGWLAGVIFRRA